MKIISTILIAASLTFSYFQSASATSIHSLNTYGAHLAGTASFAGGFGANAGIKLPDSGVPNFAFNFAVPVDHVVGNPIVIGITWHTESAAPCGWLLRSNFMSVARPGISHIQGPLASSGLEPLDGNLTVIANATNISEIKYYLITSPDVDTPLQPLDAVTFGLFRSAGSATDTCTEDVTVQGAWMYIL